jgi:uncharacterized membrane protein YoaK (UPF0700 family)
VVGILATVNDRRFHVGSHQLIAIIALILAVVAVIPIPNLRPTWPLAVAVLLLALLQFV